MTVPNLPRSKAPASTPAQVRASLHRPESDPPTREDGACIVCESDRPVLAVVHDDPFCSATCSREWHGTSLERP